MSRSDGSAGRRIAGVLLSCLAAIPVAACGGTAGNQTDGSAPGADSRPGTSLTIVEWVIPRMNSFPHDPAVDSKGVAWWTDSDNSFIGRWDPMTGATMDWPTPTPDCRPLGLVADDRDHIWYTGQSCNRIGELDPVTGTITEYPAMGDPHTPAFQRGILWFTMSGASRYGRLAPSIGTVQTWPTPTPDADPYGIWPAPDGTLWVALFGTNKIAQIDPGQPAAMREVVLPSSDARPRRIAVDSRGFVYYTDFARGRLGRYDPAAGQFREWPSPSGDGAAPYGITIGPDQHIYYAESAADKIVAFDPATEQMQSIPIPTPGSVVRNMTTDFVRRRVWMALSGVGRMAYLDVP